MNTVNYAFCILDQSAEIRLKPFVSLFRSYVFVIPHFFIIHCFKFYLNFIVIIDTIILFLLVNCINFL